MVPESKDSTTVPAPTGSEALPTENSTHNPGEVAKPSSAPVQQLWTLVQSHSHNEIWGVSLADPETHVPSQIVLQKFINAYDGDLAKAKETLTNTLDWRQKTKPLDLVSKAHAKSKFDGLGYVTSYGNTSSAEPEGKAVFTWNIYGGVKDINSTFGDLDE